MSKQPHIVHGFSNIAGLPSLFAQWQQSAGYRASTVLYPTERGVPAGAVDLGRLLQGNRLTRKLRRARTLVWLAREFEVFHIHFHTTLLREQRDLQLLKLMGKRIVFHLHGCDVRDPRRVRLEHPLSACAVCPVQCMTPVKLSLMNALRRYADAVIVSTPDLLEFVPGAIYIANPIDPALVQRSTYAHQPRKESGEFVVVHAPTDRAIKGTAYIEAAITQLQAQGVPVRLRLLEGLPREEMLAACRDADVAVDQILIGWYGLFAVEMMALGKPVVAYIRPDLQSYAENSPVVSADPSTLASRLRELLAKQAERERLGRAGQAYVRTYHNIDTANNQILDVYRSLGAL